MPENRRFGEPRRAGTHPRMPSATFFLRLERFGAFRRLSEKNGGRERESDVKGTFVTLYARFKRKICRLSRVIPNDRMILALVAVEMSETPVKPCVWRSPKRRKKKQKLSEIEYGRERRARISHITRKISQRDFGVTPRTCHVAVIGPLILPKKRNAVSSISNTCGSSAVDRDNKDTGRCARRRAWKTIYAVSADPQLQRRKLILEHISHLHTKCILG